MICWLAALMGRASTLWSMGCLSAPGRKQIPEKISTGLKEMPAMRLTLECDSPSYNHANGLFLFGVPVSSCAPEAPEEKKFKDSCHEHWNTRWEEMGSPRDNESDGWGLGVDGPRQTCNTIRVGMPRVGLRAGV